MTIFYNFVVLVRKNNSYFLHVANKYFGKVSKWTHVMPLTTYCIKENHLKIESRLPHQKTIVTPMASSDKAPDSMPVGDGSVPPGKPMTVGHQVIDIISAQMLQTLKPIKQMSQHACTFAVYGHDMSRQIECHHYITRINQDFLQCAVYDSDDPSAHLIGDMHASFSYCKINSIIK